MIDKIKCIFRNRRNHKNQLLWIIEQAKPYKGRIFLLMFLDIIVTLIGVFSSVANKWVVDRASKSSGMVFCITLVITLSLISLSINALSYIYNTFINEKFAFGFRTEVYKNIMNTKWQVIKKYHSEDLLTRLTSDINNVSEGITSICIFFITLIVQIISAFLLLWHYDKYLACFAIILGPATAAISIVAGSKLKYYQEKVQKSESKYRSFLQENISNINVIKAFSYEKQSKKELEEIGRERMRWIIRKNRMNVLANGLIGLAFSGGYLFAFIMGAIKLSKNLITYGTMTAFLSLVSQVQRPIVSLAQMIPKVISVLASAGRIMEIDKLEKEKREGKYYLVGGAGIKITDLDFSYGDSKKLENINLTINPGEKVAIMGQSGCGKTTLIRLILNFLEADKGKIKIFDSMGNREILSPDIRDIIGYIPQGNTLFSGTILDNIRIGREDATIEEVNEALKKACALEFVSNLEHGLNTLIGERGHGLSEGQAQRIAIARALIRNAPLMILDEATSALDAETEIKVLNSISNLDRKSTCIIITHRDSILPYCDKLIRIENMRASEVSLVNDNIREVARV